MSEVEPNTRQCISKFENPHTVMVRVKEMAQCRHGLAGLAIYFVSLPLPALPLVGEEES